MLISHFFLLLLSLPSLHTLHCYSPGLFHISPSTDFPWTNFTHYINNTRILTNVSSCHVRITVDYPSRKSRSILIEFHPKENHSSTTIEFGSMIHFVSSSNPPNLISYLDYRCSSGHFCDQDFLNTWPKEFLNHRDNHLHRTLLSAWKSSEICQEKFRTDYCESYLCFNIYNELKNLTYGPTQCHDLLSTHPINIHIQTKSGKFIQEYQCRKNHCTGEIFYQSLMLNNSIGHLRRIKDQTLMNLFISYRAWIIVGCLLFIGVIAYTIQCRKYRQGYRLTRQI